MAKSTKVQVNVKLLTAIAQQPQFLSEKDGVSLYKADLISIDPNSKNDKDEYLATITDKGKEYLNNMNTNTNTDKPNYGIITNAVVPPSKRGNRVGAGAPSQYPFETLEIGQGFFVPVSEKHKDPVKQLGSTVSQQNMKYAVKTGEKKEVERFVRDPETKKAKVNPDGSKVKEKVMVDDYKLTRKFVIRSVKKGEQYGEWTVPEDGAYIARVELDAE